MMETFARRAASSASTSAFTLTFVDLASANYGGNGGVGGQFVPGAGAGFAGTLLVRARVVMFEAGGGTYSTAWEKVACFRVTSSNVPTLIGSVTDGNAASGGRVGHDDLSTVTLDVSGTTIRVRVTPAGAGSRFWYAQLDILGAGSP